MNLGTYVRRSLRHHLRQHIGVVLGAIIGSAALTGALVVGDSVRASLKESALSRLGPTWFALSTGDRWMGADFHARLGSKDLTGIVPVDGSGRPASTLTITNRAAALLLRGTASRPDKTARLNRVNVIGIDTHFWPWFADWRSMDGVRFQDLASMQLDRPENPWTKWLSGEVVFLNQPMANQLGVTTGDEIILRVPKPSAMGMDSVLSQRDDTSVAIRAEVGRIIPESALGNFDLGSNPPGQPNVFLPLPFLSQRVDLPNKANLVLTGPVVDQIQIRPLSWAQRKWMELKVRMSLLTTRNQPGQVVVSSRSSPPVAPVEPSLDWFSLQTKIAWELADAGIQVTVVEQPESATGGTAVPAQVEISSPRVFLDSLILGAATTARTNTLADRKAFRTDKLPTAEEAEFLKRARGVFTYVATLLKSGERAAPYSIIAAATPPYVPEDLKEDEVVINEWLAENLSVKPGDSLDISYFVPDSANNLEERTNTFRIRSVVPLKGHHADRTIMPEFPGLAKAERTSDWNAGFPLTHEIRDEDEAYWKQWRGVPKAFISLAAGQKLWPNRYGDLTAIRFEVPTNSFASVWREIVERNLLANLDPETLGLRFQPVRAQALAGASQGQDFGGLFIGFSFFLVIAALLLMGLMLRFALEQRRGETGTLLALGFTPGTVQRLLLIEAGALSLLGGLVGAVLGLLYAKAMIWALLELWSDAIAGAPLRFHASAPTLITGMLMGTVSGVFASWLVLRKEARQPVVNLLSGMTSDGRSRQLNLRTPLAIVCLLGAAALLGASLARGDMANPGSFFGAGVLLLTGGVAVIAALLRSYDRQTKPAPLASTTSLGFRGCARRAGRSITTVALLASGAFMIISISAFRLDASRDALRPGSGTGGFTLIGSTTLPVSQNLNTIAGQEFYGLNPDDLKGVSVVPFRVREGDDASCLNLNRAQVPRVLGVRPETLTNRFTFVKTLRGTRAESGWDLLRTKLPPGEVAAIGDANSIQWALGKKVGDSITYTDESGRTIQLRLVGAVANSILQGSLIIDEDAFARHFPGIGGHNWFLIEASAGNGKPVAATLGRALEDVGFESTPATERLNAFNSVQNTYLGTFQMLGGLGLLLGSAGLGVVVLRNVLERRGELGLLTAIGFGRKRLQWMIIAEHGALLLAGLAVGIFAATAAVLPSLLVPGKELPWFTLTVTLAAVLANGLLWTFVATWWALRGDLLAALRNE